MTRSPRDLSTDDVISEDGRKPSDAVIEELHPVIQEFQHLLDRNTRVRLLLTCMFDQLPTAERFDADPTGHFAQIRGCHQMLQTLNKLLKTPPS